MRSVEWSQSALEDFDGAIAYIAADSQSAATLVANRLFGAIERLAQTPSGRHGRVKDTYEKFVARTPYIIAYAVSDRKITVLRVIHAKRDWPIGEWPGE